MDRKKQADLPLKESDIKDGCEKILLDISNKVDYDN